MEDGVNVSARGIVMESEMNNKNDQGSNIASLPDMVSAASLKKMIFFQKSIGELPQWGL